MIPISTIPSHWRYKEDFRRIGDLVNFEGPELVLFEQLDTRQIFVFDWVDRDDQQNRWLILEVLPSELLEFIYQKITHRGLFHRAVTRPAYVLDIDNHKGFNSLSVQTIRDIPTEYCPNDVSFDKADSPDMDRILAFLQMRISSEKLVNRLPAWTDSGFENLMRENQVYKSTPLVQSQLYSGMESIPHLWQQHNDLSHTKVASAGESKWLIPDTILAKLKSYGYANAC